MRSKGKRNEPDPHTLSRRIIRVVAWCVRAKWTVGSLVAIFSDDGSILLVQQRGRDNGKWGLPGGFAKRGEDSIDTAIREVAEETGLELARTDCEFVDHYRQPWASHLDHLYTVRLEGISLAPHRHWEIAGRRWVDLENPAEQPVLTAETILALEALAKRRGSGGGS
jgi:ADP-ribose pyrophosphatase YjhB (NUDIX family)